MMEEDYLKFKEAIYTVFLYAKHHMVEEGFDNYLDMINNVVALSELDYYIGQLDVIPSERLKFLFSGDIDDLGIEWLEKTIERHKEYPLPCDDTEALINSLKNMLRDLKKVRDSSKIPDEDEQKTIDEYEQEAFIMGRINQLRKIIELLEQGNNEQQ